MKKILFTLTSIIMMVCTAITFSSCDKKESNTMVCQGDYNCEYLRTATTDEKAVIKDYVDQLDVRAIEVLGRTYNIEYDEETLEVVPSAFERTMDRLEGDKKTNEIIDKLNAMKNADGDYLVSQTYYRVYCGTATVGYWRAKNPNFK